MNCIQCLKEYADPPCESGKQCAFKDVVFHGEKKKESS